MKIYVCTFLSEKEKKTQTNANPKPDQFRDPGSLCGCSDAGTGTTLEGERVARAAG